jgi:hypothetical protein
MIKRHDKLVDYLFKYARKIWKGAKKEQKYDYLKLTPDAPLAKRIKSRPGDLLLPDYNFENFITGPIWLDVTVGNNFMKLHMMEAKSGIGKVAEKLQKRKGTRYKEHDILGLGLEIFGAQSNGMKQILHTICKGLTELSALSEAEWLHRIRSKLIGHLMYENGRMVLASLIDNDSEEFQYYMSCVIEFPDDLE